MKEETQKLSRRRSLANNFFMLRLIHGGSGGIIPFMLITTVVGALSNTMINVYMFKYVLNALSEGRALRQVLVSVCVMFAISAGSVIFGRAFWKLFYPVAFAKVGAHIQSILQEKAAVVELACYERPSFFDKFIKASDEATDRAMKVLESIDNLLWALTSVVANVALVVTVSPIFLPLAVAPAIFTILFGKKVNRLSYDKDMAIKEERRRRDYVRRTFYLSDFSKEMRLTDMRKVMMSKMHENTGKMWDISTRYGKKLSWINPLVYMIPYWGISYLGVVLLAAWRTVVKGVMQAGDCFVVINSITDISGSLEWLFDNLIAFDKHSLYIENLRAFLDYPVAMPEDENAEAVTDFDTLSLRDISFTYEGADAPTLKHISLDIKKGEKIAIVGHNGAGKTTLVKLLMRLYDVTEGEVLLDGKNIRDLRLSSYRDLFGTVFQDCKLFSVTVAENVLLRGDITEEDRKNVQNSLRESDCLERVEALEHGMDTIVTKEFDDKGVVFSGGEAQKIAIARIFAGDSSIAILDEPSSALDPIAESKMYDNMFRACRDKTVIFISHRLSSATMADKIYLFEQGEILESGTHSELLAKGGKYADMWHKQAEKYVGEGVSA